MNIIRSGGSVDLTVPQGQKIAITSKGGTGIVSYSTFPNSPEHYYEVTRVKSSSIRLPIGGGSFTSDTKVRIESKNADIEYEVAAFPVPTQKLNSDLIYSVNNANITAQGTADILNKISDTEISFKVDTGSSYRPLVLTFPDGDKETYEVLPNITGISADGDYTVLIEKGSNNAIVTTAKISEQLTTPLGPSVGDYWLDLSVSPYCPKKFNGSAWVETQFCKLGQFSKTGGSIPFVTSYALNGRSFNLQGGIAAASLYSLPHNIGTCDIQVDKFLECISAEQAFNVGDRLYNFADGDAGSGNTLYGTFVTIDADKVTVSITTGVTGIGAIRKADGAIFPLTPSNWELGVITRRAF